MELDQGKCKQDQLEIGVTWIEVWKWDVHENRVSYLDVDVEKYFLHPHHHCPDLRNCPPPVKFATWNYFHPGRHDPLRKYEWLSPDLIGSHSELGVLSTQSAPDLALVDTHLDKKGMKLEPAQVVVNPLDLINLL